MELYGQTFVYVTHDQVEAMTVGQRVALMNQGQLQMVDTPYRVYNRPANIFTAKFIGSPSTNILDADWSDGACGFWASALPCRSAGTGLPPER